MIPIETWHKVFENEIPAGQYKVLTQNGEEKGLVIKLISPQHSIAIKFGAILAFRMLDEGIVLNGLFNDEQIELLRGEKFSNVIYQIADGEFDTFIRQIGDIMYEYLELKHYAIISQNFIIEVITKWEPSIEHEEDKGTVLLSPPRQGDGSSVSP